SNHPATSPIYTVSLHDALPILEQQILRRYAQPDQPVSDPLLRFGCYVAVCHMVYGSGGPLPQCSVFQLAAALCPGLAQQLKEQGDRKSTRLNSSHVSISYAVFC